MPDPITTDLTTGRAVAIDDVGDAYCPACGHYIRENCERGGCGHDCEGCGCHA